MISGFVILMTLEHTERPLDFIVSRFSKLYPCYWAAIMLTFCVVRVYHLPPNLETSPKETLINMSMLQTWFDIKSVDGVYWTLPIELSFYVAMFLLFVTRKLKYVELFGFVWLLLMIWKSDILVRMPFHIPHVINATELLGRGHLFIAGIIFYNLKTKGNIWYRYALLALCLYVQYLYRVDMAGVVIAAVFFLVFYLFIMGKLTWIINRPMIFLGSISYSLYLIHQYIGYIIIRHLYDIHANAYLRFIVPAVCSLCIATAITYAVEKPAMAYIRGKYKIWKQRKLI